MKEIEQLEELVKEARVEAEKFYNKNVDAAGTRLRAKFMEIRKLTESSRKTVIHTRLDRKKTV